MHRDRGSMSSHFYAYRDLEKGMDELASHWWSAERLRREVPGAGTGSLF